MSTKLKISKEEQFLIDTYGKGCLPTQWATQSVIEALEEYRETLVGEDLVAETLFDKRKLEITTRLYKHLSLEELEVIEAQQEAIFARSKRAYIHY